MPYEEFIEHKGKKTIYVLKNLNNGKTLHFKSKETLIKAKRIRLAFEHGWKPRGNLK